MRRPRDKKDSTLYEACYHLTTRTVNGELRFDDEEKAMLCLFLWLVAEYCGLRVITHSVMGNHLHIDIYVPLKVPISDEEILRRYALLHPHPTPYAQATLKALAEKLKENGPDAQAWRDRQLAMMGDISPFMQLLKQRYSIWYNHKHHIFGPLWNERFVSSLIEMEPERMQMVAAYVDLNPYRAGLCQKPEDYPHCGYAEAIVGHPKAREGLARVVGGESWEETHSRYRILLHEHGSIPREGKATIPLEDLEKVLDAGGKLTRAEVLRCQMRYLIRGGALGSAAFVQARIDAYRQKTGRGQRLKPVPVPGMDSLYVMSKPRNRDF